MTHFRTQIMARVTRSKSRSSERPEPPVLKKEVHQQPPGITKEPIRKKSKPASHQLIHQFTKQKLESLKPSYKPPLKHIPSQNKTCPSATIQTIQTAFKPSLQNKTNDKNDDNESISISISSQIQVLENYKMFKNMDVDIRTIRILRDSTLGEFDEYDLELKKLRELDEEEQFKKFYDIYHAKNEVIRNNTK